LTASGSVCHVPSADHVRSEAFNSAIPPPIRSPRYCTPVRRTVHAYWHGSWAGFRVGRVTVMPAAPLLTALTAAGEPTSDAAREAVAMGCVSVSVLSLGHANAMAYTAPSDPCVYHTLAAVSFCARHGVDE